MVGGGYYEMTKKFWNDWKGRFGETEQIYLNRKVFGTVRNDLFYANRLLDLYRGERILSHKFNGETVDLLIERKLYVEDENFSYHYDVKNELISLKRKDIVTIGFKKTK